MELSKKIRSGNLGSGERNFPVHKHNIAQEEYRIRRTPEEVVFSGQETDKKLENGEPGKQLSSKKME